MKPTAGRIIHVHCVDAPHTRPGSGRCTAAIVMYTDGDTFDVAIFFPGDRHDPGRHPFHLLPQTGLAVAEEGKLWHWPEREP